MTRQLEIFETGIKCAHCGQDPGLHKPYHWQGFYDQDTRQHVCQACRSVHYKQKAITELKGLYSEYPVIIP